LKGSFKGSPHGATTEFSHASITSESTLRLNGQNAGFEGALTLKGRANSSQAYTPLSSTSTVAPPPGTTAFTCAEVAFNTGSFSDPHCSDTVGEHNFAHVSIPAGTQTEVLRTNDGTCEETKGACPLKLKGTIAGVGVTVEAKKVSGRGTLVNEEVESEMVNRGVAFLTLEEAVITSPAGKGCKVKGGKIQTNELRSTTAGTAAAVKFEPASGTAIAELTIESCSVGGLNGSFLLTGSFKASPHGATIELSHSSITGEGTLRLGGQNAGLEGSLTQKGRANSSQAYTPLSST
jgi:hypothetical protein